MSDTRTKLLALPDVSLVAVSSVNIDATIAALVASVNIAAFGAAKLFSDQEPQDLPPDIEWVPISPLKSSSAYSEFILAQLADYVETSHCLIVQWDGYPLRADRWQAGFLEYDYIGASWPQFDDGNDVGNGGFSLRSRDLMKACQSPVFASSHPEDVAVCRHNRGALEAQGLRFAPRSLADAFSAERAGDPDISFGFHGVWHMPRLLGADQFWDIYSTLDERASVQHDFRSLIWQIAQGWKGAIRSARMIADWIGYKIGRQ